MPLAGAGLWVVKTLMRCLHAAALRAHGAWTSLTTHALRQKAKEAYPSHWAPMSTWMPSNKMRDVIGARM